MRGARLIIIGVKAGGAGSSVGSALGCGNDRFSPHISLKLPVETVHIATPPKEAIQRLLSDNRRGGIEQLKLRRIADTQVTLGPPSG